MLGRLRQLVLPTAPEPVDGDTLRRGARLGALANVILVVLNTSTRWMFDDAAGRARYDDFLVVNLSLQVVSLLLFMSIARDPGGLAATRWRAAGALMASAGTVPLGTWLVGGPAGTVNLIFALGMIGFVRLYLTAPHALVVLATLIVVDGGLALLRVAELLPAPALGFTAGIDDRVRVVLGTPGWRAIGLVMTYLAASYAANRFRHSEAALRRLNDELGERVRTQVSALERAARLRRYLAPQLVEQVLAAETDPVAMRDRRPMTIMFADLRGFTGLVERLPPDAVADTLSLYFDEVSRVAFRHGGTIDKFIGDAVMVFFGAPEATGAQDQARRCVHMALDVQARVSELGPQFARLSGAPAEVRIGVASGMATVGGFGAAHRTDFTVVGAPVNRAARLEPLAAPGSVLIDEETFALVGADFACTPAGPVTLKGFERPVQVYRVEGAGTAASAQPTPMSSAGNP